MGNSPFAFLCYGFCVDDINFRCYFVRVNHHMLDLPISHVDDTNPAKIPVIILIPIFSFFWGVCGWGSCSEATPRRSSLP